MGSRLQQVLRSLCFNTGWKYAVFWKLKHQTRMMFTWEDAYYDGNQHPEKKSFSQRAGSLIEGPYSHDLLGLALAKMSYQVYSLGEGIVGQVAVSGKHSWIILDEHVIDSSSSSEYSGGWQTQFSAGIKTIAVVAVTPHGVVQLGSMHKISEDLKLIDHIRNFFTEMQDSLVGCVPNSIKSNGAKSCLSDMCTQISDSSGHYSLPKLQGSLPEDDVNLWSQLYPALGESVNQTHTFPSTEGFSNKTLKDNTHGRADSSRHGNEISLRSSYGNILTGHLQQDEMESLNSRKCDGETNEFWDLEKRPEITSAPSSKNFGIDNKSTLPTNGAQMITSDLPFETHISPFGFSGGYELYEALGPSFHRQNNSFRETQKTSSDMAVDISKGIDSCSLLMENSDIHLLEAVVAKISDHKTYDLESEKSCRESLLTAERTPCNSICTFSSLTSFVQDTSGSLNSVTCGVESWKGFSSASSSRGSEHSRVPVKMNKKRGRPGESCRPRPRDRQLIQDRIKELRELVPNGSKCSIDSLLDWTIKHMMFLQSVTKHAEKLHKCSASKLLDKDRGIRRFSCREQGSSWAVEVGNNQNKICPIIVENINMNGQMLVEMLSKECGQFLEIAKTIRSLGLTILKGVSEAYGYQTWMCFVVEGQNNQIVHRMDVLWSLCSFCDLNDQIIYDSDEH